MSPSQKRYLFRGIVAGVLAGLSVAATVWVNNPYVQMAAVSVGAFAAYLGIGAATPLEPSVGKKN